MTQEIVRLTKQFVQEKIVNFKCFKDCVKTV